MPGDGVPVAGPAGGTEVVPGLQQGQTGGADQVLVVTAVQRTGGLAQTDRTLQLCLLLLDIPGQELQYLCKSLVFLSSKAFLSGI